MTRLVCGAVAAALLAAGCQDDEVPDDAERAPAAVERRLPTDLYLANLCPGTETPPRIEARLRRQAQVLLREAREHPDWLVEFTYYDAHGEDEVREITVRQLAREHMLSIDGHGAPCEPELREQLEDVAG